MLNQDFKEFVQSLNDNQVRYLVIGAYAVAVHGYPRYTQDLDIWIDLTPENAAHVIKALDHFGFGSLNLQASDFLEPDQIVQLGYPPNHINLITTPAGVDFATCYASRLSVTVDDVTVFFIDLENLRKAKTAAGRLQDLADLEHLGLPEGL